MKQIKMKIAAFAIALGVLSMGVVAVPTIAAPAEGIREGLNKTKTDDNDTNLSDAIRLVTNVLLFIIGAVSVIMLIIGGLKYVTSNGDSNAVTSAKNTILYAIIGIIVALLAYAIVGFVVDQFVAPPRRGN